MDLTGNWPGKSVYIIPLIVSARAAKQNSPVSWAAHTSSGGLMSWRSLRLPAMSCACDRVDRRPLLFLDIWPFHVAVDGGRFLRSVSVSPVNPSNCPFLIALQTVDTGGENNDWW